MKQKLQDLILLIKQEKKYQVLCVLVLMGVLWVMFSENTARIPKGGKKVAHGQKDNSAMGSKEAYEDLMKAMREDVNVISENVKASTKQIETLKVEQDKDRARVAEIFKKMLDRLADVQATTANGQGGMAGPSVLPSEGGDDQNNGLGPDTGSGNEVWGKLETSVAPPPPPPQKKIAVIAPGDSVRVKLIAAVNAPTDGTPYPVLFKLIDDVHGPDSSTLPLGEARVVAAAQGNLSDQRALFRLTELSIRLPDGRRKYMPIDGWVVGEDGIRGMEGILIDPIGKAIAGAAEAGAISGIGEGFAQSQQQYHSGFLGSAGQTTISGDPLVFAAGKAASGSANVLTGIIKDRLNLLVPHIKVYSGREATAVFSKPVNITDLYETLENGDTSFANSVD